MLDWSKCAARLESFIFDYSLIKQILSVQHEHMTRYINQLRHLLALICRRALEKTFRNVHLGIKRSNHLVMCHSIQHLQEFILLLLLLKLFIGCDIRKVYSWVYFCCYRIFNKKLQSLKYEKAHKLPLLRKTTF